MNYTLIVLGVIAAGGIWTGTNPAYTVTELTHQISKSSTRFIISEPEILTAVRTAGDSCGIPRENYWVFDNLPEQSVPVGQRSWRTLLQHGERDWVRITDAETSRNTTCMRLFSSGTTGLPKAANLSHANFIMQHTVVCEYKSRTYEVRAVAPQIYGFRS